jgi:hypothetical protein
MLPFNLALTANDLVALMNGWRALALAQPIPTGTPIALPE